MQQNKSRQLPTKKSLAVFLSRLNAFSCPEEKLEQYSTDSEAAADVLWTAFLAGDIKGKTVADLGAGTGILGIGSLLLGAEKAIFVEKEKKAIEELIKNLELCNELGFSFSEKAKIINSDISKLTKAELSELSKAGTIIQNPPFGTRQRHIDKEFLMLCFKLGKKTYSLHKSSTKGFLFSLASKEGFSAKNLLKLKLPLKKSFAHHKKAIKRIEVSVIVFEKKENN